MVFPVGCEDVKILLAQNISLIGKQCFKVIERDTDCCGIDKTREDWGEEILSCLLYSLWRKSRFIETSLCLAAVKYSFLPDVVCV